MPVTKFYTIARGLLEAKLKVTLWNEENMRKPCNCVSSKRIANENDAEIEHWLKNINERECKNVSAMDMNSLASLRDWERRDSLRRLLENKYVTGEHEEL
ncbi:hypothetical protein TELCIR_26298 [Teladorsagia circumcincta]|uniref:Uncharacterized protein n=1 Tax=Teladorsagia circumcincta TaxID=45464 RepID=A0A2G9T379_TELCI|nr:hypothetical protein TELCIR_26298 [Teladorsagia circumcincta]